MHFCPGTHKHSSVVRCSGSVSSSPVWSRCHSQASGWALQVDAVPPASDTPPHQSSARWTPVSPSLPSWQNADLSQTQTDTYKNKSDNENTTTLTHTVHHTITVWTQQVKKTHIAWLLQPLRLNLVCLAVIAQLSEVGPANVDQNVFVGCFLISALGLKPPFIMSGASAFFGGFQISGKLNLQIGLVNIMSCNVSLNCSQIRTGFARLNIICSNFWRHLNLLTKYNNNSSVTVNVIN